MGNNPINRNDPDGLVDFIYTPGNSRPRIEYNWSNLLSLNAYAEQNGVRYPLGDGGVPAGGFDQIIGQNVTSRYQVMYSLKVGLFHTDRIRHRAISGTMLQMVPDRYDMWQIVHGQDKHGIQKSYSHHNPCIL